MNKIELLAPAGNLEKAKIAILYGADAVYIGGKQFSLRSRASNFSIDEIAELVKFANAHLSEIRIHADVGKEILEMGIPTGIQNSLISISNVVVQSNINSFGSLAMAGVGTYTKIEGFAFLPITSFMMALTTFVSQNRGAKEYKRARKGAHFGLVCSVSLAETIGLLIALFATPLMRLFVDDPKVIQYGVERAHYATILFFLLAYSHGVSAVLRGVGKSVIPMVVMLVCWCLVRVTLLTMLNMLFHNIVFVYLVYPFTWSLSSIVFFLYYRKINWKE